MSVLQREKLLNLVMVSICRGTVGLDPIKCAQDTGEMATSQFQRCQTVFADFSNPSNINATSARRFCDSHCPQYLVGLLGRLVRDCGLPSSQLVRPLFINSFRGGNKPFWLA